MTHDRPRLECNHARTREAPGFRRNERVDEGTGRSIEPRGTPRDEARHIHVAIRPEDGSDGTQDSAAVRGDEYVDQLAACDVDAC